MPSIDFPFSLAGLVSQVAVGMLTVAPSEIESEREREREQPRKSVESTVLVQRNWTINSGFSMLFLGTQGKTWQNGNHVGPSNCPSQPVHVPFDVQSQSSTPLAHGTCAPRPWPGEVHLLRCELRHGGAVGRRLGGLPLPFNHGGGGRCPAVPLKGSGRKITEDRTWDSIQGVD